MAASSMGLAAKRGVVWRYFTLLALANLMWSSQGVAVKVLDRQLGPIAITFAPFWVTTVLLLPVLIRERRRNACRVTPTPRDWLSFAGAGIGGQVLAQLGMTWGITKSLASNGAILNLLIPVISAILASVMLRERLTRLRSVSFAIGLAGVLLMSIQDLRNSALLNSKMLVGNLLIFAGCAGSSFYNVYCKGLMRRFPETEILIYSYVFASLASIPLLIWVEPLRISVFADFDWRSWAAFAFLAIFMYGVSMLLFFHVLQFLDVTVASASLYMVPLFGVILGATLLGERLSAVAIAGAGAVLGATILIMRFDQAQPGS
jgi:drug/metabolite transporter (DMT)-like permease